MNTFFLQKTGTRRFPMRLLQLGCCLAFFCTLAFGHEALAQGAAPMSPESEWKVSDVRDEKRPAASYCTLTRAFSQGVILTIGRNMREETSLAIDFQKKSFSPDKTYTIAMNAGPGARRAFEARPASPSALVMSTGKDDTLYAGIRKSGKLDVSISGAIYSFHIDGLGEAMDRLSGCTESIAQAQKTPTPTSEGKPADPSLAALSKPVAAPSPESLKKPKSDNGDIASLREENRRLTETLEKERRAYENKSTEGNALIELREKVLLLEKENESLKKNPAAQKQSGAKGEVLDDLATLRAENGRLRKALADEKSARVDVPEAVSPKAFAALRQQYESLKAENERLRKSPESVETAQADTPLPSPQEISQARILEEKLVAAQKRVDDLAKESDRLRAEKEKLLLDSSGDNWNAEEATRRYNEADREARRLSVLLDQKTTQCTEEKTKLEAMLFDPAVTSKAQIAHLAKLEEALQQAKKDVASADSICEGKIASAEKSAVDASTKALKEKVDALKTALNDSKTQAQSASETLARKEQASTSALASLKADYEKKIAEIKQTFEQEKTALTAKITAEQDKDSRTSEEEKTAIVKEIQSLKTSLVRKETEFRQAVARLESEKSALAAQAQAVKSHTAQNQPGNETTVRIAQEVQSLRAEMAKKDLLWKQQADMAKNESEKKIAILESEKNALQFALSQIGSAAGSVPRIPSPATQAAPARLPSATELRSQRLSTPVPRTSSPTSETLAYIDAGTLSALLRKADIAISTPVESVSPAVETTAHAFRWESGPLFGSAEERGISEMAQFDDFVSDYLDRTRSRCTGDFAFSITSAGDLPGHGKTSAYEIACVSSGKGASAALLFAARDGIFTVIAHESGAESIDSAVDARDRIYNILTSERDGFVAQN